MITLIQPGAPIAPISIAADSLAIGDITVNFAAEQKDTSSVIVIRHYAGAFVRGGDQGAIVAVVCIPARRYTEQPGDIDPITGEPITIQVAEPFDPNTVSVELWPFTG
jgi:hypothetical protein